MAAEGLVYSLVPFVEFISQCNSPTRTTKPLPPNGGNAGDSNLYGYVLNDPVNSTDASGLDGFLSRIKKKLCGDKCGSTATPDAGEASPKPGAGEGNDNSEGNGVTAGKLVTHVATDVAFDVAAEAASHAVETPVLKGAGPAMTIISGAEVGAEGVMAVKKYNDRINEKEKEALECETH